MSSVTVLSTLDELTLAQHRGIRAQVLEALSRSLKSFDQQRGRAAFAEMFRVAQGILEFDDEALAEMLRVSPSTIERWAQGESAPHQFAREPVFRVLARATDEKLRLHAR